MLRRFYKFYRNFKQPINGALLGLIIGLMLVFAGFWKTLLIAICAFVGYYVGNKLRKDKDFLKKLLDRILPPGMFK